MSDKIQVNDSLSSLDLEAAVEPYVFALPGNKLITFPDPLDMPFEEAEEMMNGLTSGQATLTAAFSQWLTEEDFETLMAAKLTMRQVVALSRKLVKHYSAIFGTPGN